MKNDFEVRGPVTAIFLDRRDGSRLETLISTEDLPKLQAVNVKWAAAWRENTKSFYCLAIINKKTVYLHRFIMEPAPGELVDHRNHNTLINTRDNLRNTTPLVNRHNRKGGPGPEKAIIKKAAEKAAGRPGNKVSPEAVDAG